MPTLELLGQITLEVEISFARLHHKTSPKRRKTTLVGHSEGTRRYRLRYDNLAQRASDGFDELWDFYTARQLDGAAFDVTDPLTGDTVSVRFRDNRLSAQLLIDQLYSLEGVALKAARATTTS